MGAAQAKAPPPWNGEWRMASAGKLKGFLK